MSRSDFVSDLIAMGNAVRKRLEQIEPHVKKISDQLRDRMAQFVKENPYFVESLKNFADAYPKLEPHLQQIEKSLNDPELEIANDVLTLAHIFDSINKDLDPSNTSLLSVIASPAFHGTIVDFYKSLPLDQKRVFLIEEALLLHREGHYAGSVFMLYGLIEGVITESFKAAKLLTSKKGSFYAKGKKVNGLGEKIQVGINNSRQLKQYFSKMDAYKLVASGSKKTTIASTRNLILHGNCLDFNTERRSAQLILWFYSVELNMKVILPVAPK